MFWADSPFGRQVERKVLDRLAVQRRYRHDKNLSFGFLINFGAERGELVACILAQNIGEIVDVACGLGRNLNRGLTKYWQGDKTKQQQNQERPNR